MSDANRTQVAIVEEATFGVIPATPRFELLRVTGESLSYTPKTVTSDELRADRQVVDLIRVGFETAGDLPIEMSYGMPDRLMEGAACSDWVQTPTRDNDGTASSNITTVAVSGVFNYVAPVAGNEFKTGVFAVGQLVRTTGFSNAGNNGLGRVTATTATQVTLNGITSVVDAAPATTARLKVVGIEAPAATNIAATVTGLAVGSSGAITGTGIDFLACGLVAGMWFKASGFTIDTDNNGWYRALSVAATRIECDIVPTGFGADAATGVQVRLWLGDYIRNGTTKKSYTAEIQYQDLTVPEFEYYRGMRVANHTVNGESQSIVKGGFSLMGASVDNYTTRNNSVAVGTDRPAPTNDVLNTSDNVGALFENGVAVAAPNSVMMASLTIDNTLRRRNAIGSAYSIDIGLGRCMVTGTLKFYYGSNAILNRIRTGTASSYMQRFTDPTGTKALVYDVPRIKFSSGVPVVSGVDTDRTMDANFQGLRHPVLGYTIHVQRFEEYV